MHQKIGSFNVLLLEGTLDKDNLKAIIKKAMDLFEGKAGFMQCCSIEFVPSLDFVLFALENALMKKPIGSTSIKKNSMSFLLWLYCTSQLNKALKLAGKTSKGMLLVIVAREKLLLDKALKEAIKLGFSEKPGLIEKNFGKNLGSFIEHFGISKNELEAIAHLPKQEAVEKLITERQALLIL